MRTVVVTGAASGIGRATYDLTQSCGDRVIGVDLGGTDVAADLTTESGRRYLVDAVADSTDVVSGVVACAGIASASETAIKLNYFGAVATLNGLRPLLARAENPRAVVLASVAAAHRHRSELVEACLSDDERIALTRAREAVEAGSGWTLFSASKVAIVRWVRRTAALPEWAGNGIALNAVAPGVVDTPMIRSQLADENARAQLDG